MPDRAGQGKPAHHLQFESPGPEPPWAQPARDQTLASPRTGPGRAGPNAPPARGTNGAVRSRRFAEPGRRLNPVAAAGTLRANDGRTRKPAMTTTTTSPPDHPTLANEVIVYSHSWLVYWWPVWAVGYLMALLTWLHPVRVQINGSEVLFSSSTSLGVIFALVVLLTILITNTHMRGLVSLVVVLTVGLLALLFAYLDWWPVILRWFGHQDLFVDQTFFLFFSTGLLGMWLLVVLLFDHLSFWRIRPGQVTHEYVLGAVESSYDTDNMVFTKQQADIFRNWILGLGSGDLQMQTMGGRGMVAQLSNVLFVNARMAQIERLIATKPDVPQQA
jgi:hypothetical protein